MPADDTDEPVDVPQHPPSAVSRARRVARARPAPSRPEDDEAPRTSGHISRPVEDERPPAPRPVAGRRTTARPTPVAVIEADEVRPEVEEPAPTDDAPKQSRAGRNLPAAIGVGLGLGAIIIISLFVYRPSFAYIVGAAVLYGCYELWKAFGAARIKITLFPLIIGSAAMLVAAWTRGPSGLVLAALVTVLGVVLWRLGEGAQGYTRDAAASVFAVLYLPLLAGFAVLLAHPSDGAARVLVFVATVVCSDTGGYATGVLIGRHPLAPVVSKGKTWEGFAGSVIACSAAGVLFFTLTFHEQWWKGLLFGLAITVTATLGDLGESMIKRDLGIKDMGSLLPGHGGVMDRLDSLLPCAVVAYLVLSAYATRG